MQSDISLIYKSLHAFQDGFYIKKIKIVVGSFCFFISILIIFALCANIGCGSAWFK